MTVASFSAARLRCELPGERAEHSGRKPGADAESGLLGGWGGGSHPFGEDGNILRSYRDRSVVAGDWSVVMSPEKPRLFSVPVFGDQG